jgi:hypothetical protein
VAGDIILGDGGFLEKIGKGLELLEIIFTGYNTNFATDT